MKKLFLLALGLVVLNSCNQDITSNTPAFVAKFNDTSWKAKDSKVTLNTDGSLTITAFRGTEVLEINTSSSNVGSYILGTINQANFASYIPNTTGFEDNIYETEIVYGPVFSVQKTNSGTGYSDNNSALTSSAMGSGFVLKITTNALGAIITDAVKARGVNYKAGDVLTVEGGNNDATFRVVNVQQSNGEIVIEESENGTFTGTFKLNAVNADGEVVTFSQGNFYKVPISQ